MRLINADCLEVMRTMENDSVDLTLTDIPYAEVSRASGGLRNLDKGKADILTFDLDSFLTEVYRVTKGTCIIFCGMEQFSRIFQFFACKKGTVRQIVWCKSNPSPMNGQLVYLSGTENAVWLKKKGAAFNARCKPDWFTFPCGRHALHPTQKNISLFETLLLDNSAEHQTVFDPCMGSATTGVVALRNRRNFIGVELDKNYFENCVKRLDVLKQV